MRPEAHGVVLYDSQLVASLVDELAQLPRPVHDVAALLLVLGADGLPHLLVLPRRGQVELHSALELLLGLDERVKDPLPVLQRDVGPQRLGSLIEGVHLFLGEFAVQHLELLTT